MTKHRLLITLFLFLACVGNAQAGESALLTVASYATSVEDQDAGVKTNLQLACRRLNGYVIMPKSVVSFSEIVGEGSAKNGFVNGRVLYRDEVRYEPGGGLCQASTTLFNVLLAAGFIIIERHRHLQPVTYVPLGLDATIRYGKKDLKMKNPFQQRFRIEASLSDKSLLIALKSETPLPYRYELVTEEEDVEIPLVDRSKPVRQGISVYVSRNKMSGNTIQESTLLYKDFYPPVYLK
jgi:vancomycin resistance protein YoaR